MLPGFLQLTPDRAGQECVKALAEARGRRVVDCRRPAVMTEQMGDAKMQVEGACKEQHSERSLAAFAAVNQLMGCKEPENARRYAGRGDETCNLDRACFMRIEHR